MADPFAGFERGYRIGSTRRKPFQGVLESFKTKREEESKLRTGLELDQMINPKEQAGLELTKAKTAESVARTSRISSPQTVFSPSRQIAKDKRTQSLFDQLETNAIKKDMISKALESLPKVPQGFSGKWQVKAMKQVDPTNPILGDWQNIKSVLTDAQLMNVAKTKGAISDREMELFAQAAANDDTMSIARMKPVIERLSNFLEAQDSSAINSYRKIYNEDPLKWPELSGYGNQSKKVSGIQRADMISDATTTESDSIEPDEESIYQRLRILHGGK